MAAMMPVPDTNNHSSDSPNYRQKSRTLKRKLKFLLYEQEYFQEELRKVQKKLLRVSRDKSFLLDRLLQYENVEHSSSDEDSTASSSNSDTEGQRMMMAEAAHTSSRSKKSHAPTIHNHAIPPEGFGMYSYASPSGSAESGGNTGPEPGSNLVQCKFSSNGKQCQELVSKRSKSGYCNAHRTVIRISKQSMSLTAKPPPTHLSEEGSRQNDLVVDQQQLERLQQLGEPSAVSQVPQATEQLPQDMFNVDEDDRESENEDSPGSTDFHGNVYEGDDDLVIDLPE